MTDLSLETPPQEVLMQSWGATLFRNLESFPGQLATTPPILSAREEGRRSRKDIVRAARNVERFSAHVRGGIDPQADLVVGSRLTVRARPDFENRGVPPKDPRKQIKKAPRRQTP